jgi:cystathionine beta-lyase/cystathionine gamma-synthase
MKAKKSGQHSKLADSTLCIHAGEDRHGRKVPLTTEIAQTSVFALPSVEELRRYAEGKSDAFIYTRYGNPTTSAAEAKIAALEGGEGCVITASGQAATLITVLATCRAGDEMVSMLDIYGGTLKLFEDVFPRLGIRTKLVSYEDLERLEDFFNRRTKLLFLESPTNPTLRCVNLEGLARKAARRGIRVAVDNTFATPILQKPLALGADVTIHSATKYLGGHSDLTAGAIVGAESLIASARTMMIQCGGSLDPFASYLLIRGLKTLELRVQRACLNASHVAQALSGNPKIARVMYPGFAQNEGHAFAQRQMSAFGMMVAIELRGGGRAAEKFIDNLKLWYLATSLGGVESTVSYPMLSSHLGLSSGRLRQMDVSSATVRLSVGIEDSADLIADLEQALAKT